MLGRNAVALDPRVYRVNGNATAGRHFLARTGSLYDVGMGHHAAIMHNALRDCKRLLHYRPSYALCMTSPGERLRLAREAAGYATAVAAADALGVPRGTYIGHENGGRGFPAGRAAQYGRKFKVAEQWLLYGKGERDLVDAMPPEDTLAGMIELALRELPVGTPLGEFPRLVAPALREQLERFQADLGSAGGSDATIAHDKDVQSPAPTKRGARA